MSERDGVGVGVRVGVGEEEPGSEELGTGQSI